MRTLTAVADVFGWVWRSWVCNLIDWIRPGAGHNWTEHSDPPACTWCGMSRGAIYKAGRWR